MRRKDEELFHVIHKVPAGDSPYVRAKRAQVPFLSISFLAPVSIFHISFTFIDGSFCIILEFLQLSSLKVYEAYVNIDLTMQSSSCLKLLSLMDKTCTAIHHVTVLLITSLLSYCWRVPFSCKLRFGLESETDKIKKIKIKSNVI